MFWSKTPQVALLCLLLIASAGVSSTADQGRAYWYEEAGRSLHQRLKQPSSPSHYQPARSVVLMVGDGLDITTTTAARILKGQRLGQSGENNNLAWDKFPAVSLAKTYNLDAQIGESSACATALLCGVKANFETVGLDGGGKFEDCYSSLHTKVDSLMLWAQQEGKSTGLVTNTRVSHATPAALYAHSASRYWEDDGKVPPRARKTCKDITRQLIEDRPGIDINVILGGGRRHWLPKVARDPEQTSEEGRRLDGRNLIEDWLRDQKKRGRRAEYVWNKQQLEAINTGITDHLLGLFAYSHMEFEAERDQGPMGDPSLTDMTLKAMKILLKNPHGFFLFIESGRIDHAHHYNNPYRALDETLLLDEVAMTVLSMVDLSDTLVVITSDHSHVMTFGGLATPIGNPILGTDTKPSDMDGLSYSSLLYGNGPGYMSPRAIPSNASKIERNAVHGAAIPRQWATHGGQDVPVFAQGPMVRELFSGTVDQSYIPHAIAYIACIGPQRAWCSMPIPVENTTRHSVECSVTAKPATRGVGNMLASSVMSDDNSVTSPAQAAVTHCYLLLISLNLISVTL